MKIITTKKIKPPRVLIYGEGGVGKTSLLSQFPNAFCIDVEDGANEIGVARPEDKIKDLKDIQTCIEWLCGNDHDFKTVFIDSADWLERKITDHVEKTYTSKELSYGQGAKLIRSELGKILAGLDWLREYKNMIVGFTAHAKVKEFKDPLTANYDRYTLNCVDEKFGDEIYEWADLVGFAKYKVVTKVEGESFGKEIVKAKGSDEREIHFTKKAGFRAKNRYGIDKVIHMTDSSGKKTATEILKKIGSNRAEDKINKEK